MTNLDDLTTSELQPQQPVQQSMDVELVLDVTGREEAAAR